MRDSRILIWAVWALLGPLTASVSAQDCGCNRPTCASWGGTHCGRPRCCVCCPSTSTPRSTTPRSTPRLAEAPSGPVVYSLPFMQATPMMMAMPMMPMMVAPTQARAVSYETPRAPERSCASSQDRLDELESRVEALHVRMKTIQRAVEIQTAILEELKDRGAFGGKSAPKSDE